MLHGHPSLCLITLITKDAVGSSLYDITTNILKPFDIDAHEPIMACRHVLLEILAWVPTFVLDYYKVLIHIYCRHNFKESRSKLANNLTTRNN